MSRDERRVGDEARDRGSGNSWTELGGLGKVLDFLLSVMGHICTVIASFPRTPTISLDPHENL